MSSAFESLNELNVLYAWLPSEKDKAYPLSNVSIEASCPGIDIAYDTSSGAGVSAKITVINKCKYSKAEWYKPWTWFTKHGTQKHQLVNERADDITEKLTNGKDICIYIGNTKKRELTLLFCGVITQVSRVLTTAAQIGIESRITVDAQLRDAILTQGSQIPTFKIDGAYGEVKIKQSVETPKKVESDIIDKEIDGALGNYALNISAITATVLDGSRKPDKYKDASGTCYIRNLIDVDEDDDNARIEIDSPSQGRQLGSYLCAYITKDCAGLAPYTAFLKAMSHFYIVPVPKFPEDYEVDRYDYILRPGCVWAKDAGYELERSDVYGYELSNAGSRSENSYFSVAVRYASPKRSDAADNIENYALYVGGYDDGKPWMKAGNEVRKKWGGDGFELETGFFHTNKDLTNLKVFELPAWVRHTEAWGATSDMAGIGTADPPEVYKKQKKWADCVAKQIMASLVRSGGTMYINVRYEAALELRNHMGEVIEVELPERCTMTNKSSKMFTKTQTWYGYLSHLTIRLDTSVQQMQMFCQITLSAARPKRDHKEFSVPITDLYDID